MPVIDERLSSPAHTSEHDPSNIFPESQVYLCSQASRLRVNETVWHPPTDVYETSDCYFVKIELGGVVREEILVTYEDGILAFRGRRSNTCSVNKIRYRQAEIKYGLFEVCLRLPDDVDINGIRVSYSNGFLEAALPKQRDQLTQTTRVAIQIG
ncbi:MAG: Hsp20/alpha crystallin family protein [Candidatus Omnitrophica bacterium]|nr:Hsp20/alpha crystallin family protein [Candidatus Omnitrophota bacterium]